MTASKSDDFTHFENALNKTFDTLKQDANKKRGGTWTTSLCVVGKDIATGIALSESAMEECRDEAYSNLADYRHALAKTIREKMQNYGGHDTEGFVAGAAQEIAHFVESYSDVYPRDVATETVNRSPFTLLKAFMSKLF